jgi:malate dehydrogenase
VANLKAWFAPDQRAILEEQIPLVVCPPSCNARLVSAILLRMSRSVAIIGASGAVGSALAAQMLRSQMLEPADRLQLVGHGASRSEAKLLGTRIDLLDAFDDERVDVEVVPKICDVDADIVIVAAGATVSPQCRTRRDLGVTNRLIFEQIAEECADRVPEALFIVVSNPIELAVRILSSKLNRRRVIGMGAQQDSFRFARAIANDLAISRHDVRASVLGEHGQAMVPIWSAVELLTSSSPLRDALDTLKQRSAVVPLRQRVVMLQTEVSQLVEAGCILDAYDATRQSLPDARIFVEPFITAHTMHSTPNATSNATLYCLAAALANDRRRVHGQVRLEREVLDLQGVCGIPLTLSHDGWHQESLDWLDDVEKEHLRQCVASINEFIAAILSQPPGRPTAIAESANL